METFEEKFRNRYQLSEADASALLSHMEEVRFKKREVIVQEGTKNTNLYLIKEGIWRGHYLKDGVDTSIWFASKGEAAFSVWGYVDNSYSQISIEAMSDSIAYCISKAALNELYSTSIGLAKLGKSQRTVPDTHKRNAGIVTACTVEVHCIVSMDHTTIIKPNKGGDRKGEIRTSLLKLFYLFSC